MKYYIIAGEASGDVHGANLMQSIHDQDTQAVFRFWGGDAMSIIGGKPVKHVRELAFMGFWEVITHLRTILGFIDLCKRDIIDFHPDVIVLIDYPGFNLRIAQWAKQRDFKVVYYIVPQVWAWHTSRVNKLKAFTSKLIAILPFESDFYKNHGCDVEFVGHPLLDEIQKKKGNEESLPMSDIALLPGSRKQEIKHMLPIFLQACERMNLTCSIAVANNISLSFYKKIIDQANLKNIQPVLYSGKMYSVLKSCPIALVTSGTATLETALLNVPQIVAYKGNLISYHIAKRLIKLPYISLVNLILNRKLVVELIQENLTVDSICREYNHVLKHRKDILQGYSELKIKLGQVGASDRAAKIIIEVAAGIV